MQAVKCKRSIIHRKDTVNPHDVTHNAGSEEEKASPSVRSDVKAPPPVSALSAVPGGRPNRLWNFSNTAGVCHSMSGNLTNMYLCNIKPCKHCTIHPAPTHPDPCISLQFPLFVRLEYLDIFANPHLFREHKDNNNNNNNRILQHFPTSLSKSVQVVDNVWLQEAGIF